MGGKVKSNNIALSHLPQYCREAGDKTFQASYLHFPSRKREFLKNNKM